MDKSLVLTQAKNAEMAHDFPTAARLYKELLRGEPSNVEYLRQLGSIYVKNGEDAKAIPYYEQIINFYPHHIESMNSLGAIYRRLKRYEDSISILQRALDEGRQSASVNYNLGFTYKEMGNYEDAIDAFNIVIHSNPDDVLAYNHLGSIYYSQKDYDKSIASYKKGLQIDQNHPILNYNLARCYEAAKNYPESVRCYQIALKTKPGWIDAIQDFSHMLINSQKNKEAAEIVQQAIKLHPNDVDLLNTLGRVYLNEYDFESAEKTYKQAKKIKENDVQTLSGLTETFEKSDKINEALETVLTAMELEPLNKDIKKQYAHTLLSAKEYDSAQETIQDLYNDNGQKDVQVLDLCGQYYICKNDEEKAKSYFSKIKTLDHHYKDYMINAAKRAIQINKLDTAEEFSKEYIANRPSNSDGYIMMGKILNKKGDFEGAKAHFEKSSTLTSPNVLAEKQIQVMNSKIEFLGKPAENKEVPTYEEYKEIEEEVSEPKIEEQEEDFDFNQMGDNPGIEEILPQPTSELWDEMEDGEIETEEQFIPEDEEEFDFGALPDIQPDSEAPAEEEPDLFEMSTPEQEISEPELSEPEPALPKAVIPEPVVPEPAPLPPAPPVMPQPVAPTMTDFDRQMQQTAMNAAITAQNLANQLAEQQRKMQEENEKLIKEQVEIAVDEKFQELELENENKPEEVPEENLPESESKESEETAVEENNSEPEINNSDDISTEKPTSIEDMLEKIEKILNDDDIAKQYADEIEMFKKLRILANYLPESEKGSFLSGKIRMLIEYIISKMSGKPGLLVTAQSLIKSGVLGEEYNKNLEFNGDFELNNDQIENVLRMMKSMCSNLEDKSLAAALSASADNVLEKIEIVNQKSQIFS